jgi:23S rRNA (guanosine2251-2'-O)-methyltransferase
MRKEAINFKDSAVFEGMTSIRAILRARDAGINDRRITTVLYDREKMQKIHKEVGYLKAVSEKYGFSVVESSAEEIEKNTLGQTHGGIIALAEPREIPCLTAEKIKENGFYVMIQGIEDPYNFGYSIRSLFASGVDGIVLPERNWMSAAGVVARSSAGASEELPMYTADAEDAVKAFKSRGYTVVCADLDTEDVLGECTLPYPIFLIVGGERRGISKEVLALADKKVKIEYAREFRASLSAASATTMFAYEIMRQNKKK